MTPEQVRNAFIEYREGVIDMRDKMNHDYIDWMGSSGRQIREGWKFIATSSGAVLALTPFVYDKSTSHSYVLVAAGLYFLIILLVALYLRETLDKEHNDLQAQQDTYNNISDDAQSRVEDFLKKQRFSDADYKDFWSETTSSIAATDLGKQIDQLKQTRNNRANELGYFGEFLTFTFIAASICMLGGFIKIPGGPITIAFTWLLVLTAVLSDFTTSFMNLFSRLARYLKTKHF